MVRRAPCLTPTVQDQDARGAGLLRHQADRRACAVIGRLLARSTTSHEERQSRGRLGDRGHRVTVDQDTLTSAMDAATSTRRRTRVAAMAASRRTDLTLPTGLDRAAAATIRERPAATAHPRGRAGEAAPDSATTLTMTSSGLYRSRHDRRRCRRGDQRVRARTAGHRTCATPTGETLADRSTSSAWPPARPRASANAAHLRGRGPCLPGAHATNIRLYSEDDIRRVLWIRHLTQNLGVNLAGVRILFELEERLGMRILETLFADPGSFPGRRPDRRGGHAGSSASRPSPPPAGEPDDHQDQRTPRPPPPEPRADGPRQTLALVALRETVIFPEMIVPLQVGRDKSVKALNQAVADDSPIALVTQRQAEREDITEPAELYAVGTLAKIAQVVQLQDGTVRAIVQGQQRLRLLRLRPVGSLHRGRGRAARRRQPRRPRGPGAGAHRPGARSSSTSSRAHRCRRRRPWPPATSPSRACWPTWSPTARTCPPSSARSCSRPSTSSSA